MTDDDRSCFDCDRPATTTGQMIIGWQRTGMPGGFASATGRTVPLCHVHGGSPFRLYRRIVSDLARRDDPKDDVNWRVLGRETVPALLDEIEQLRDALNDPYHYVTFDESGWAIEHTMECRKKGMLACPVHRELVGTNTGPPMEGLGRYRVTGESLLLEKVT